MVKFIEKVNIISKASQFIGKCGKSLEVVSEALEVLKKLNAIWDIKENVEPETKTDDKDNG